MGISSKSDLLQKWFILSLQMKIADILQSDWLRVLNSEVHEVSYPCLGALSQSDSSLSDLLLFESSQPIKFQLE